MCNYHKKDNMGKIQNCFIENSDQFVDSLSKNLNHIVYMLNNRGAITEKQKLSIHESPSPYSRIKKVFEYIEINDELEVFINVLDKTENSGIAHYVRLAARYYFTSELLKSHSFEIGTDVVLSCKVSDDHGVKWFKSGIEISANKKYNVRNNGLVHQLIILNAQAEDAGDYLCECCYARSQCTLKAVIKVIEVLKDTEVEEGGQIHLTCKLNADVDITWGKNGQKLPRNMQTYFNKTVADNSFMYTLTIKNAKEENSGEYSFVYENLKTSCHVIVKEKPVDLLKARTTEILYEITDTKKELEKKQEEIEKKEENLAGMENEIRTKEIEIETKTIKLELKEKQIKQIEMQLESNEEKISELENEKFQINEYCSSLRQENEKLKRSRENANIVHAELEKLKVEKQKLADRVTMLEQYIDTASEAHKRTIEEMLSAQKITIAELKENHETTLNDIRQLIQDRDQSKTCAVS